MLWMCEPVFYRGKYVVVDSGFCFKNGIVALAANGVYAGALVKKHQYWPQIVPVDLVDQHYVDKVIGDVDILEASTEDSKPFRIFCFKESD